MADAIDLNAIREYFGIFEDAYLQEFERSGFDEPPGRHTPSPFLGINRCLGQLVRDATIADKPVLVLGSGDSRINVALNYHGRDSYGLEHDLQAHRMVLMTVRTLKGHGLIRSDRPIVLGHGDFFEPSSYDQLGMEFHEFATVFRYDGTDDYNHMEGVAHLVAHESEPGTALLLVTHNGIPFHFDGISCNKTYKLWGKRNSVTGLYLHVYKRMNPIQELQKKHARHDIFVGASYRT